MVGSVYYMSPEQIEGHEVDARSDIYSLGVTFYELVTGKRPFNGDSEYQILAAHLKGTPQPPRELDQSLPAPVSEIILTAMARDANTRFGSAKAMRTALTSLMHNGAASTAPYQAQPVAQPLPPAPTAAKSHRTLYMALGSIVTLAVLIGAAIEAPNFRHAKADGKALVHQQAPAAVTASTQIAPPPKAPPESQPAPSPGITTPAAEPIKLSAKKVVRSSLESNPAAPAPQLPLAVATTQTSPPPSITAPKQDDAEVSELRDRLNLMGARVSAVRASLDNIRRAQAQSGLGLRSDMVAAEERMLFQLGEADRSLGASDAPAARKRIDAAETDLGKLEHFLGK